MAYFFQEPLTTFSEYLWCRGILPNTAFRPMSP